MHLSRRGALAAGLAAVLVLVAMPAAAVLAPARVQPSETLPAEDLGWQFVFADRRGRLTLARGEPLHVRSLATSGKVGAPVVPDLSTVVSGPVREAAMSADGGTLLLLAGGKDLALVRGDKVEPVSDPRWKPFSIGMHGDQPLLGVHPVLTGRPPAGFRMPSTPPLVLAYDGRRWSTLLDEPSPEAAEMDPQFRNVVYRTTSFATAPADDLWIADHYRYRIRRLTAAGREKLELTIGDVEPRFRGEEELAEGDVQGELERRAAKTGHRAAAVAFTGKPAIAGMAEGRDGLLYVVVAASFDGARAQLHRFDAANLTLERAPLDFDFPGRLTLAAASDGLWIAAARQRHELWRLTWGEIAAAEWEPVEGVRVDGVEMGPGSR
jgi:hypothetical protein